MVNKERLKEYHKKYYQEHKKEIRKQHEERKEEIKAYNKKYYREHRKEVKKYHQEHKKEQRKADKRYYWRHREKEKAESRKYQEKRRDTWRPFFAHITSCEICGKPIVFASGNIRTSVHFDHKQGGKAVIKSPSSWVRNNLRTSENEAIWKTCNFGKLCQRCNQCLPTKNRLEWLEKALKYTKKRSTYE